MTYNPVPSKRAIAEPQELNRYGSPNFRYSDIKLEMIPLNSKEIMVSIIQVKANRVTPVNESQINFIPPGTKLDCNRESLSSFYGSTIPFFHMLQAVMKTASLFQKAYYSAWSQYNIKYDGT